MFFKGKIEKYDHDYQSKSIMMEKNPLGTFSQVDLDCEESVTDKADDCHPIMCTLQNLVINENDSSKH